MATNYTQEGRHLYMAVASGVAANDPVLISSSKIPGVAQTDRDTAGKATVDTEGVYNLSVKGLADHGNLAIAAGDPIYYTDGDSPKLNAKGSGTPFGIALTAVSSGSTSTIEVLLGKTTRRSRILPLDIAALREISSNDFINTAGDAGVLSVNTTPKLERVNAATDKASRVVWAAGNSDEVQWGGIPIPQDCDITKPIVVNLLLAKGSNTDAAAVVAVNAFVGIGDTNAGGNTAALAVATLAKYTVTIAPADLAAYPSMLNLSIIPGTHANDAVHLHAAWLEYTAK